MKGNPLHGPEKTPLSMVVDLGVALFIALILLPSMLFFDLILEPYITAALTGAVPLETATGVAIVNASVATRLVDIILSLATATGFMYLAQMYRRPYGITIALMMALCSWVWYFWEVGGVSGMLDSEYGMWREVIVFMQAPIAFVTSRYLRSLRANFRNGKT